MKLQVAGLQPVEFAQNISRKLRVDGSLHLAGAGIPPAILGLMGLHAVRAGAQPTSKGSSSAVSGRLNKALLAAIPELLGILADQRAVGQADRLMAASGGKECAELQPSLRVVGVGLHGWVGVVELAANGVRNADQLASH